MVIPDVLILAAGQGKRMRSELPKVLHTVLGRPMLHYVIDRALEIPHGALGIIIGHGAEHVRKSCQEFPALQFVEQSKQLGTGHAVLAAKGLWGVRPGSTLVLSGDVILLKNETLNGLIEAKDETNAAVVLTTQLTNPTGYGRIKREGNRIESIIEEVDCTPFEKNITEINSGVYLFDTRLLFKSLERVTNSNKQNEFYLTDVIRELKKDGHSVVALETADSSEVLGINDPTGLFNVQRALQKRINETWMNHGVFMENPESIFIDQKTRLSSDVRIESGCRIFNSLIAMGVTLEANCRITGTTIGSNSLIRQDCYIADSKIESNVTVGPFAHLRPGSRLSSGVKIGNFVEVKNSQLGENSKASHLSYIGDATIGREVNLGCGFITCNYDGGPEKHQTTIEDRVFIGSDSQVVAPVLIGSDSYVASGTTVTEDVPKDSLVLSRGRQVTKLGYSKKHGK